MIAIGYDDNTSDAKQLYRSDNGGILWEEIWPISYELHGYSIDENVEKITVDNASKVWLSLDGGETWNDIFIETVNVFSKISKNGLKIITRSSKPEEWSPTMIKISVDDGETWSEEFPLGEEPLPPYAYWSCMDMSSTGAKIIAGYLMSEP